jgi:hypothetical protein
MTTRELLLIRGVDREVSDEELQRIMDGDARLSGDMRS